MKLDKSCGNCRYSRPWGVELACVRNPPAVVPQGTLLRPIVHFGDTCGEFRSTPPQNYDFNTQEEPPEEVRLTQDINLADALLDSAMKRYGINSTQYLEARVKHDRAGDALMRFRLRKSDPPKDV